MSYEVRGWPAGRLVGVVLMEETDFSGDVPGVQGKFVLA